MTHYEYIEPTSGTDPTPVTVSRTREQIITEYFPSWAARMCEVGRAEQITLDRCIDDWCVIHWATRKDEL